MKNAKLKARREMARSIKKIIYAYNDTFAFP